MRTLRTMIHRPEQSQEASISFEQLAKVFIEFQEGKGNAAQTIKHYEQSIRKLKQFLAYHKCGIAMYHGMTKEEAYKAADGIDVAILNESGIDVAFRAFLQDEEKLASRQLAPIFVIIGQSSTTQLSRVSFLNGI